MSTRPAPRVFSIPPGAPFLETLADAFLDGRLVGALPAGDPLAAAGATIYVPTRRAARELRAILVTHAVGTAAILPTIRPLGEFEEDAGLFDLAPAEAEAIAAPPIAPLERILMLAPLVRAWKGRLPAHVERLLGGDVVVPASASDAVWLARDLAALIDEVETEGADWSRLAELVPAELAGWWQVTLDFLRIVTEYFPAALAERGLSSPGAHRAAMIDAEARRLATNPPAGPVIAAGSTGSIPATARLLAAIARLPNGAVVLPGLDRTLDTASWDALATELPAGRRAHPSIFGHPQFGLRKLLATLGLPRDEVVEIGTAEPEIAARAQLLAAAMRPAETTDLGAAERDAVAARVAAGALDGVTLLEAAGEREEAEAIAVALRLAVAEDGRKAALVTGDRALARRVASHLRRFGIRADDSAGRPLSLSPPAQLLLHLAETACRPGDPVAILSLVKHPLLRCGLPRADARRAAEALELVGLRGGVARPDIGALPALLEQRPEELNEDKREPFWLPRLRGSELVNAQLFAGKIDAALAPLLALIRGRETVTVAEIARASVESFEALGRDEAGGLAELYAGETGEALAGFLRELLAASGEFAFAPGEWCDMLPALMAGAVVKPAAGADPRVAIWGPLEARLLHVDTIVLGGLNEGSWPRRAEPDRFLSRLMKSGLSLEPPERRIGQAAHDFAMAAGMPALVLSRSARAGDAPAVASRWLQRLGALAGKEASEATRARGRDLIAWSRDLASQPAMREAPRPRPTPPLVARPLRFSVTEVETLRRDPYAVYARKVLALNPLDPLLRDPGAADRGNLFHDILYRFALADIDASAPDAGERLLEIGRIAFAGEGLPRDVEAVWWPRFVAQAVGIIDWERAHRQEGVRRLAETRSERVPIGATGVTLNGVADRIDLLPDGRADILDFKTGSYPSKRQAHMLVVPQLSLEAALLARGGFGEAGARTANELAYVRLKADGSVLEESIRRFGSETRTAEELGEDAWARLEKLVEWYRIEANGYVSRALPFREQETDGNYDHLARVQEWSAGSDAEGGE